MMSSLSSIPAVNFDRSSTRGRRRKKKVIVQDQAENHQSSASIQWKSDAQQQIYSSKLLHALRHVSSRAQAPSSASKRVREAANRVLAATARGRWRWSRAILTNRLKLNFIKKNMAKQQRRVTGGNSRAQNRSKVRLKSKCLPAVERKARLLGRLVPGCRKQPLQVVLGETIEYIPALEMQVRAMSALAELLSVSDSSSGGSHAMAAADS